MDVINDISMFIVCMAFVTSWFTSPAKRKHAYARKESIR
jgi:hypothetical protein